MCQCDVDEAKGVSLGRRWGSVLSVDNKCRTGFVLAYKLICI